MNILVLSDSLCLPRSKPDQHLDYADTWPSLLSNDNPDFNISRVHIGSGTSEDMVYQAAYWTEQELDLVIFQFGVVDALPRALRRWELELLKILPCQTYVQNAISRWAPTLRKYRRIRYTSEKVFRSRLHSLNNTFPRTLWIGITRSEEPVHRLPKANEYIDRFNLIMQDIAGDRFISMSDVPVKGIMPDQFHLNAVGHRWLFELIRDRLAETLT